MSHHHTPNPLKVLAVLVVVEILLILVMLALSPDLLWRQFLALVTSPGMWIFISLITTSLSIIIFWPILKKVKEVVG